MRKYLTYLLALICVSLVVLEGPRAQPQADSVGQELLPLIPPYQNAPKRPGLLVVDVVDSATRQPLPGIDLSFPDGGFVLPTLRPKALWLEEGVHRIQLFRSNYSSHWINDIRVAPDSILWLTVPMGNPYVGAIKSLNQQTDIKWKYTAAVDLPAGSVEGNIRDDKSGLPVVGAVITPARCADSAISGSDGRFQLPCRTFGASWFLSVYHRQYGKLIIRLGREAPHDTVQVDIHLRNIGRPQESPKDRSAQKTFVICRHGWGAWAPPRSLRRPMVTVWCQRVALGQEFGPADCDSVRILRYLFANPDGTARVVTQCGKSISPVGETMQERPHVIMVNCEPIALHTNTLDAGTTYRVFLNCEEQP